MLDVLGLAAAIWGGLMAISPLLQVRRIVVRRSSADVSLTYLLVLQFGCGLWVAYGLAASNLVVAIPNAIAFAVGVMTILVTWRYRQPATR